MESAVEAFIARWTSPADQGGQERANYALFLTELTDILGVPRPRPAVADATLNDYVFERAVKEPGRDGSASTKWIDLYKRGCFVLEAKQSRLRDTRKEVTGQAELLASEPAPLGRRQAVKAWDVLMMNARRQAEDYVRLLPPDHTAPPFVVVCDVGHCFELYANFRGDGRAYEQFPDRQNYRIYLEELRDPKARDRLKALFDPVTARALDPAIRSANVTRQIAARLAKVSKALEAERAADGGRLYPAHDVAAFLSRCLFTMFAEDAKLLPENSFKEVLARAVEAPERFVPEVTQLWEAMDTGGYAFALGTTVKRFNGAFFKSRAVLPLRREEIGELLQAAKHNWRDVEPAIFGTLLEQALDPAERASLGAHYTPRAYVERLVQATIIEPLRADWDAAKATAERLRAEAAGLGAQHPRRDTLFAEARTVIAAFHAKLCETRVLDPAAGTGNFLYVALELMKRLEGEVLEALEALGGQEGSAFLARATVDPHGFLGLELNPRAAKIAELVLWIGYLQWHVRTRAVIPPEPILQDFKTIETRDAVVTAEIEFDRDAHGRLIADPQGRERLIYKNPRRPDWPQADFIVGNPPFIGGKDLRARLGDAYAQALWAANGLNESADFVMYWWNRAAELLTQKGTRLRRFGFVTTNSISQVFQRRVLERHLDAKKPISLIMAVPDHPWTKTTKDAAAVRIAMTVAEAGTREGLLREVSGEAALDTDEPRIDFTERVGRINSDLTVGVDVGRATPLRANEGLCSRGMALHGAGFIVTPAEAEALGLGRRPGLENHIRPYRNGRDLTARSRGVMVIDLDGLNANEVRLNYPEVYQHLLVAVKPERDRNNEEYRRINWWLFGRKNTDLRSFLKNIKRYIVTVETAKHRLFIFIDAEIRPDNKLIAIGTEDAWHLGLLSSRFHVIWALRAGGLLEDRPVYVKSQCFDPFPFPDTDDLKKHRIRQIAEELDAHRKRVLAEHPHLTLTGLYNVLERLKAGVAPDYLTPDERRVFDDGLILILKELHDRLDRAVADAYQWPVDLSDDDILARLVALNAARAAEEARGLVRWLRPDYQIPRFGSARDKAEQLEATLVAAESAAGVPKFPAHPVEQTAAVMAVMAAHPAGLSLRAIVGAFKPQRGLDVKVLAILAALTRMGHASHDTLLWRLRRAA